MGIDVQKLVLRLRALGLDGEEDRLACLVRSEVPDPRALEEALQDVRRLPPAPETLAVEGRLLVGLGRVGEGRRALEVVVVGAAALWLTACGEPDVGFARWDTVEVETESLDHRISGIQTALDSLLTPKARGARAETFMDTSLMEEIKKSGFIDRLYGRAG